MRGTSSTTKVRAIPSPCEGVFFLLVVADAAIPLSPLQVLPDPEVSENKLGRDPKSPDTCKEEPEALPSNTISRQTDSYPARQGTGRHYNVGDRVNHLTLPPASSLPLQLKLGS